VKPIDARGARKQASQLSYATIQDDLNEGVLQRYCPPKFGEVFDVPLWKKGGSDFQKQSKRFVASIGELDGINVYVYHANASPRAAFLVAWVAEALRQEHNGRFLLVGDFNCEPTEVNKALWDCGVNPELSFKIESKGRTHNAKGELNRTFDYAIAGFGVNVTVLVLDIWSQVLKIKKQEVHANNLNLPPGPGWAGSLQYIETEARKTMSDHLPILVSFP
jgi:hypothetical protein